MPVKIRRDTGSAQTFIVENTLKYSPDSFQEAHVFVSGMFSKETSSAPLHTVYLKSVVITGPVTVDVAPFHSFLFKGIQIIVSNDVTGQRYSQILLLLINLI